MLKSDGKEYKLKWSPETFSAVAPPQVALSERNNSIKKKEKRKERKRGERKMKKEREDVIKGRP